MLELICDQDYILDGIPADRSPYRNHGKEIHTVGAYNGYQPGSGIIEFPFADSRVIIPPGEVWSRLRALRIDILARVERSNRCFFVLVEGKNSFRFGVAKGALEVFYQNVTGNNRHIRAAEPYSLDHRYHPVPENRWIKLSMYHDGFAKMRLFHDDHLVAEASVDGCIPPVTDTGISIGNSIDYNGYHFPGKIDRVQIWRLNPEE